MRIVVTGGSGKAGRWVVRDLRERGHDVLNVDVTHDGSAHGLCVSADLTDLGQCHEVVAGADAVVHLAAVPAPDIRPAGETFRNNAMSTYNVFAAARAMWSDARSRPHGASVAMLACVATGVEMDSHRGATGTHRPLAWAGTDASWRESHEAAPSFGPYRHKEPVLAESVFNAPLSEVDPEIAEVLELELGRQRDYLEMIASENFVPVSVLQSQGSVLTNKYAEGYPGRRYYGGCEYVDVAESLAIERAKSLFGAEYANVQPHSGATANAAVLSAIATPGDTILGLELAHGGHLTHGMRLNFSGKLYNAVAYGVDPESFVVDMNVVRDKALEHKPQVIIAGWSAYPRQLDFAAFREIADEVGAKLWVDMAHFAGLVAAGLHPNPVPHADVVSSTVHKTIGGPRSGFIVARDMELAKKLNSNVFPGQQGGPLMHVIAAKATAFKIAASAEFKDRQERTIRGAKILAERLTADDSRAAGVDVLTGGTDVHLVLADLRHSQIDGQQAEDLLHEALITVNRNAVPFDPRPPMVTSGLRIGTPALATRGFGDAEFTEVADIIALALQGEADVPALRSRVEALTARFPLYPGLAQ